MPLHIGLHKHAFWLYGVIVALAIQKALLAVVPDVFAAFQTHPAHPENLRLESYRLIVFLVVTIRFFLGSVAFFEDAYESDDADAVYPIKNYARDYVFGLIHFLFFFAWSMSIDAEGPLRLFPILMALILFYDIPWYFAGRKYDTKRRMKLWAVLNALTLVLAWALYSTAMAAGKDSRAAQAWAFIPVIVISILDIAEIIGRKEIFKKWIGHIIDLKDKPPPPSSPRVGILTPRS